jgi:hypothetical protein
MKEESFSNSVEESSQWKRPEPERFGPKRNGWAKGHSLGQVSGAAGATVEKAVNLGYKVIEKNIQMGQAYARCHASESSLKSGHQDDVLRLCGKMIQLGREFSSLYFDAVEKVLHEVNEFATRRLSEHDRNSQR